MFVKHNPEIGARPGTLAIPPDSPEPEVTIVRYDAESLERIEGVGGSELSRVVADERATWVDVRGLGDATTLETIGKVFDLHPIALENAVNVPQRAKNELYDHHQLIIARAPLTDEDDLGVPQVCFIVGSSFLITFQERPFGFFEAVRERMASPSSRIRNGGPDYLAYALIDAMIDHYYPVVQDLADRLEDLEEFVTDNPHPLLLTEIQAVRRQLVVLRRVGWPQREALGSLLRSRTSFIGEDVVVYLRDTYDHIAQIVELIDSSRDMASDLAESYLSSVSHRSNEIMKVLTLMASVFIPLTFVAGIYGMNFENMPELRTRSGYFVVLGAMGAMAAGMLVFFRRRGWLGRSAPPEIQRRHEGSDSGGSD